MSRKGITFLSVCFSFLLSIGYTQASNIDSLKSIAQTAPFPERLSHLINWYQQTNELFHEPEIAMMQLAVDYLESLPQMDKRQRLNWGNFKLIMASMYSDNEELKKLYINALDVINMADSLGGGAKPWITLKGQGYFYLNSVAFLENRPEDQIKYLDKAYQCFEEIDHQSLMAQALGSMGVAQNSLGHHEEAYTLYDRSANIYKEQENERGYLRSTFYKACELKDLGKYEEAEADLSKLIPRLRETEHPSLNIALTYQGGVLFELGRIEAAESILAEALELAKKRRVHFTVAETCQTLANIYEKEENYERALFFQREQANYIDSIRLQSADQELKEAQAKFDQTENKQKIKELEQKIVSEQRASILKLLALAIGLLGIGLVVFWFYNQKKKKEIEAAARTLTVDLQSKPKENQERIDPILENFLRIVEKEMASEGLSVEKIAQTMKMSRVQLFKKVKSASGASPSEIIRQFRLEAGKKLLLENKLTISEIAYQIGFSNPNSFGRAFKRRFGSSPSEFSNKNKGF